MAKEVRATKEFLGRAVKLSSGLSQLHEALMNIKPGISKSRHRQSIQKNQSIFRFLNIYHWLTPVVLSCSFCSANAQTPFTVVALPDTQNYVNNASNAPLFTQQTQWIADQIQTAGNPRNIQFVTHLGDLVSEGNNLTQWQRADASMDVLDGVVEYSVLPGNHDYNSTGNKSTGTVNYVNNFGPLRFAGESWYGGADPSGNNSYQTFSAGGFDFIHLALEWQPSSNVPFRDPSPIEWAQSVIDANPNTPVILSTHEYVDDNPVGRSGAGEALWNQLVRHNDQIFMVLNGHFHSAAVPTNDGEYHQVSMNDANRPVFEVLQDYQDYPNGGNGWLRLINFDIPNDTIEFETYSPVLDQFQTETVAQVGQFASQFEFNVDFSSRLTPVIIPPPPPPPTPDLVFQEGVGGYTGTFDKEIRSDGADTTNGQAVEISVDGDDGSPGLQPNQGLIRFDNIIGSGSGQLAPNASIDQALLVLEVNNPGSGFAVHELLTAWDENSTWQGLVGGVQPDGVEAVSTPIVTLGANNGSENVPAGTLEIDVTSTIQDYLNGSLTNLGWALLPYTNGTNGIDFYSSENAQIAARPSLQIFFQIPEPSTWILLQFAMIGLFRQIVRK
ncbi:MAG: DNRLRE domain-containing protein [Pirellulales bacterium]|nr:DNRLRE domain-containing protein [Pirellulales bacterium]